MGSQNYTQSTLDLIRKILREHRLKYWIYSILFFLVAVSSFIWLSFFIKEFNANTILPGIIIFTCFRFCRSEVQRANVRIDAYSWLEIKYSANPLKFELPESFQYLIDNFKLPESEVNYIKELFDLLKARIAT